MDEKNLPGYELGELIGQGAMGEVYRATQTSLGRRVALKILPDHLYANPDFRKRFITEARIAAQLQHPNIVSIFDVGEANGVTFIAMSLVEGESLDRQITSGGLPFPFIENILRQLASALDHAHDQGFLHRDVKPGNVFVTPDSRVLLMDFGIAKAMDGDANLTTPGFLVGTPKYSAPEIIRGGAIDRRSDLYSMGVLAFEMVAGRPPFDGTNSVQVALQHTQEPIPDLQQLREDVSPQLQSAIEKLLAKNPDQRFATAQAFIAAAFSEERELKSTSGGLFSWLLSKIFGRRTPSATDHPVVRQPQRKPDAEAVDQTIPPGTMIAPIPPPAELPPTPSASQEIPAPDKTMIVNVRSEKAGADNTLPVAMTLIASPNPSEIGRRVAISHFPFIIGRGSEAGLSLSDDLGISRRHLVIGYRDGGFRISDHSTNGTFINGRLLAREESPLLVGDTLVLSTQTTLRFVADVPRLGDLTGVLLDGRYELERELYSSIKASVYIAHDTRLPRTLTIKVFSPSLATLADYRDAYRREADVAAKLTHPHIRKVIDRGESFLRLDGKECLVPYLCMDEMRGGNLSERLARADSPPELAQLRDWIASLADALACAHGVGVVHGGLKPSAILFDGRDQPFLADFAQAKTGEGANSALVLGSPAFMAPEQWEGVTPTEATDQYAFACLIYLMLTGSTPYEGQVNPKVRQRNFERGPAALHEQAERAGRQAVPRAVSDVIAKALSNDPGERFPSVPDFAAALNQAFVHGRCSDGKARIFISYRRDTSAGWAVLFARELREKHAIETFLDIERRDSAVHFPEKLKHAISDCDVFVCLLAGDSLESAWVREEIRLAHQHGKPMIPVFQESYRDKGKHTENHIKSLLHYDGVHLLDRLNIHVDHSIADLAQIIHRTVDI